MNVIKSVLGSMKLVAETGPVTEVDPVTQATDAGPATQGTEMDPVTQKTDVGPATEGADAGPATQGTDAGPATPDTKQKPLIRVHRYSQNPNKCWDVLKVKQRAAAVMPLPLDTPVYADKLRFVCLSDTHVRTDRMTYDVPNGDVLLHAGDFTNVGQLEEILHFNNFLAKQPHRHKVVIAGNHDLTFDENFTVKNPNRLKYFGVDFQSVKEYMATQRVQKVEQLLQNCIYLKDSEVSICGVRIYGSPWQPEFGDWGFNLPRGQKCLDKWNLIPDGVDVLMTHGPPVGHGDFCFTGKRAGCVELLSTVQKRVKPKYHVFGHIHEGYGVTTDGVTTYINASTCSLRYNCENAPVIFDVPLPAGQSKDWRL